MEKGNEARPSSFALRRGHPEEHTSTDLFLFNQTLHFSGRNFPAQPFFCIATERVAFAFFLHAEV